jgi:hypothetical protein
MGSKHLRTRLECSPVSRAASANDCKRSSHFIADFIKIPPGILGTSSQDMPVYSGIVQYFVFRKSQETPCIYQL